MLARKTSSKVGKNIPQDWAESLSRLLNETYKKNNTENDRFFDVYGQIYPGEMLIIVSWLAEKDQFAAPITCFISCEAEHIQTVDQVKKTQSNYIDLVGMFFDEIFNDSEWNEFEPLWQEVSYKQENYFFKISRENINLTIEADKLLGPDFDADEE